MEPAGTGYGKRNNSTILCTYTYIVKGVVPDYRYCIFHSHLSQSGSVLEWQHLLKSSATLKHQQKKSNFRFNLF